MTAQVIPFPHHRVVRQGKRRKALGTARLALISLMLAGAAIAAEYYVAHSWNEGTPDAISRGDHLAAQGNGVRADSARSRSGGDSRGTRALPRGRGGDSH